VRNEGCQLFQEIILVGMKVGLVKIWNIKVSIDGSKIRSNASEKLSKDEKENVTIILKGAENADKKENLEEDTK